MALKKGMLFTFVVLIALSIVFLIAFSQSKYSYLDKQQVIESRILTMNDFVKSFESDASRAAYISGFRSLIALEDYVAYNAEFVNDTDFYFKQIFYDGIVQEDNFSFDIMNQSTFKDYQMRVNIIANDVNLEFNSSVTDIRLRMFDPWTVEVTVDLFANLSDLQGLARWEFNRSVNAYIPILDLRDPLYSVNSLGKLPVTIRRSPYQSLVNDTDDKNDTYNLQRHLNGSYYLNNTMAPNFLMRFENNLSPDQNGIESLVDLQVLADQGTFIGCNEFSVVDYLYFNETQTEVWCSIQNMVFMPDNWFVIDAAHSEVYQINNTLTHVPCTC